MKRITVTMTLTLCFLLALVISGSYAATPWKIEGVYLEACNCDMPCPCATGGKPTNGFCQGASSYHVAYGYYGDVILNDINFTIIADYPGDPMDGNATIATYISENATPEQVEAIKSFVKEDMGALTAKDLGTKLVNIAFGATYPDPSDPAKAVYTGMSGDTYKWVIPGILEIESTLKRDMPDVPGYYAPLYHQAEAVVYKYKDYGLEWEYSGTNSWQGRLLMPPQPPSDKVVATIRAGVDSQGIAVNPYTRIAVVTNVTDDNISIIDLDAKKQMKTIPVGNGPFGPAIEPRANIAIIPNNEDDTVSIVDLATFTVKKVIPVGDGPTCAGVDSAHNIATIPNFLSGTVSVIDLGKLEVVKTIPVGNMPVCMHWCINPFTNQAIVSLYGENALAVIDLVKGVKINQIPVGEMPDGAYMNPYTNMALVSNMGSGTVSVIDLNIGEVINTIPVGGAPVCGVIEPTKNLAIVSSYIGGYVNIIDLNTMSIVDTVTSGVESACAAIDEATMTVLVTAERSNDVTIIDLNKVATATEDYSNTFSLELEAGLNMISLPLKPYGEMTARDLMNETGSTIVVGYDTDTGRFTGFTGADSGDGFPLEGGKGYIVNVHEGKVVSFMGAAWTNEPSVVMPAPPAEIRSEVWAFIVSGNLADHQDGNYTVTATNLRTGAVATNSIMAGRFNAVFADLNRNPVIKAGDKMEIVAKDSTGNIVAGPVTYQVSRDDIGRAFKDIPMRYGRIIPEKSVLLQNFPNPFNPETWIPFQLSKSADVSIRIYDASGKLVRNLALGRKEAGIYADKGNAIHWDGKSDTGEEVSSGIYFYSINAGEFSAIRKMIVKK